MTETLEAKTIGHADNTEKGLTLSFIEPPESQTKVEVADVIQAEATPDEEKRVLRKIDLQ